MKLKDNTLMEKVSVDNMIQKCDFCDINTLAFNKYNFAKGYGKLLGWGGKSEIKYFFVGLNPSYRRFKEHMYAFGGEDCTLGTGKEFVDILKEFKLIKNSYITNLVKCSTLSNSVKEEHKENCLSYLIYEIELLKPKKIIALGKDVYNFLKKSERFSSSEIYYLYHPNYVFSYCRDKINELKQNIREICNVE